MIFTFIYLQRAQLFSIIMLEKIERRKIRIRDDEV
jgi:hypothetical protein